MRTPREDEFFWPDGCLAAVSLSFDDGSESQRTRGVSILNQFDVRGTFYVNPQDDFRESIAAWQDAFEAGHEIANHTVSHPCSQNFQWISDNNRKALEDMTIADMENEILLAKERLEAVFPDQGQVSFAYPCYQPFVGYGVDRQSYVPIVAKHCVAGRGRGERANNPWLCDLGYVWSYPCERMSGPELVGLAEEAVTERRWTVLTFHGIHEGHLSIGDGDLATLCEHLDANRDRIWSATVAAAANHIRRIRADHGMVV